MEIIINTPETEEDYWAIPFNNIQPRSDNAVFFYLRNSGESSIELESISISSSAKMSFIHVYSVLGEADFYQEASAIPVNKNTWRNGTLPDIEAFTCGAAEELYSQGQLDRLDMPKEGTTYKTKPDIKIGPNSIIVIAANTLGTLSGIVTISQEIPED